MHSDIFSELNEDQITRLWAAIGSYTTILARSAQDRTDQSPRARALDGFNEVLHMICSQIEIRLTKSHRSLTDEEWLRVVAERAADHGIKNFEEIVQAARMQLKPTLDLNDQSEQNS